ncbi:hypothetical protein TPHA_0E03000 [Tetrapisispora phaffii CBS 4417]|uniref:Sfi1 spindle body domain-containing protein n=1 Tax=Tetrapisispora phaffii (strain ATCC 24235 / CBS 4417 / NBRC 1672 / NRRL Y-8282 / UCD 70-5) TaxID=1071381 RepID=G8BU12_TETPH|nr:hypothetical protein TPHA_0E03000 [Tetrapisispora phaffii CBS 4417]CCE63390.1 hypothetical protein TPHA_0E03000 [Tetrapisispora phaffii CBS 4417]
MENEDSTDLLLNDNYIQQKVNKAEDLLSDASVRATTNSLLNKDLEELLRRVSISDSKLTQKQDVNGSLFEIHKSLDPNFKFTNENQDDRPLNSILDTIYNRIQVFLIRNKMSLDFLKIFKKYVHFIEESGSDPLADKYLIDISTQLDLSFDMTPFMNELYSKLLLYPETLEMRFAYLQCHSERKLLEKYFQKVQLTSIFNACLRKLENEWNEYMLKKHFMKWINKQTTHDVNNNKAMIFNSRRLLVYGFDNIYTNLLKINSYNKAVDEYSKKKIFATMSNIMERQKQMEIKAMDALKLNTLKHFFKRLHLNHKSLTYKPKGIYLQQQVLKRWKSKITTYRQLEEKAELSKSIHLLQPLFKKWVSKIKIADKEYDKLIELERKYILKKFFRILTKKLEEQQKLAFVQVSLNKIYKKMIFQSVWRYKFEKNLSFYSFQSIQEDRTKKNILRKWKLSFNHKISALNTYDKNIFKNAFKKWKYRFSLVNNEKRIVNYLLHSKFERWNRLYDLHERARISNKKLVLNKHLKNWKQKRDRMACLEMEAERHYMYTELKNGLKSWKDSAENIKEMSKKVATFQELMLFKRFQKKFEKITSISNKQLEFQHKSEKRLTMKVFKSWSERYIIQKRDALDEASHTFRKKFVNQKKIKFLQVWKGKHILLNDYNDKAAYLGDFLLREKIMKVLNEKLNHNYALSKVASNLRNETLQGNSFTVWKEKLIQSSKLEVILKQELDNKNIVLLLNYLNIISLKMLKIRRNREMIKIFRDRWDRAILRGLILLWKTRMQNSPKKVRLRRKSPFNEVDRLETPKKSINTSGNTIPGSELVKNYKVEAMKSRYSRVRHSIPSPIKNSSTIGSTIKRRFNQRNLNVSPFPASPPKLNLYRRYNISDNKNLEIDFNELPYVKLEPIVDKSEMEQEIDNLEFHESPTQKTSRSS